VHGDLAAPQFGLTQIGLSLILVSNFPSLKPSELQTLFRGPSHVDTVF
jgi:hypothetical protein